MLKGLLIAVPKGVVTPMRKSLDADLCLIAKNSDFHIKIVLKGLLIAVPKGVVTPK